MKVLNEKPHLLVVDDDDRLRSLLTKYLSEQDMLVSVAANTDEARRQMAMFTFDLLILDGMMPGEDGIDFLAALRRQGNQAVLMLSARAEVEDRIRGLEVGAEDYLSKPFDPKELVLRIHTILKRASPVTQPAKIRFADYEFDRLSGLLTQGGQAVALTTVESLLLRALAATPGEPVARERLAESLPGNVHERSIDVQVARLRKKLGDTDGASFLQTVRGSGYVLYENG